MKKKIVAAMGFSLLLTALSVTAARRVQATHGASRIAYVSMQRMIAESPATKAEAARLESMRQEKSRVLRNKQQALENTRQELARAASGSAALPRLRQEEQQRRSDFEQATVEAQTALQALQHQLQSALRAQLKAALDELATRQGVQIVLNEDTGVVWASPGSDLTGLVVQRLNRRAADSKSTP